MKISKRHVFLIILSAFLVFSPLSLRPPTLLRTQSALAGAIVHDPVHTISNFGRFIADELLKFSSDRLKQEVLKQINKKIIGFVQNNGNPRFVLDWGRELEGFHDIAFDAFIRDVGTSNLPSNIKNVVLQALDYQRFYGKRLPFSARNLDIISGLPGVGGNLQNFINKFDNGGWAAFTQMSMPIGGGNPFWSLLFAYDEAELQSIAEAKLREEEIKAADGYKPTQRCEGADVDESQIGWESQCDTQGGNIITTEPGKDTQAKTVSAADSDQKYIVSIRSTLGIVLSYVLNAITSKVIDAQEDGLLKGITFAPTPPVTGAISCGSMTGAQQVACLTATGDPNDFQQARTITVNAVQQAITDSPQLIGAFQQLYQCELNLCIQGAADPSTCANNVQVQNPQRSIDQTKAFVNDLQLDLVTAQNTNSGATLSSVAAKAFGANIPGQITQAQQQLADCQSRTESAPTLALAANPTTASAGGPVTITWVTTNLSGGTCNAVNGWSGNKAPTGGNETVTFPGAQTTYRLICTNTQGTSIIRDVVVGP